MSDNRAGDPNPIPIAPGFPIAMISDLDGQRLVSATASTGGQAKITIGRDVLEIQTGRSGVITSFSSAGPTDFDHLLKPDISAPGAQILSSTLPEFAGLAVRRLRRDEHGDAAHRRLGRPAPPAPSELDAEAGEVGADVDGRPGLGGHGAGRRRRRCSLEGAGLAWLPTADDPSLFTDPQSLSLGELNVDRGAQSKQMLLNVSDAGGGDGTWQVELHPQSASTGASLDVSPMVIVAPGGDGMLTVTARAAADAVAGDDYGFLVLRRGNDTRRIPYDFFVGRPGLARATADRAQDAPDGRHAQRHEPGVASTAGRRRRSGRPRTTPARRWTKRARSTST